MLASKMACEISRGPKGMNALFKGVPCGIWPLARRVHHQHQDKFQSSMDEWLAGLGPHIARCSRRWQEPGFYVAIVLSCSLLGFGLDEDDGAPYNVLPKLLQEIKGKRKPLNTNPKTVTPDSFFQNTLNMVSWTLKVVLGRGNNRNILQFAHCMLVFIHYVSHFPTAFAVVAPWLQLDLFSQLLSQLLMVECPNLDVSKFDTGFHN